MLNHQYCDSDPSATPSSVKAQLLIFLVPSLLLIPVLYYSLTTPFALVDDYGMCYYVEYLDNLKRFIKWADQQFLQSGSGRYRPFFDLYNMVTWKVFGPIPWLHHLSRWVLHFSALLSFSAAFLCCAATGSQENDSERAGKKRLVFFFLPLAYLVYLWMFFPNSPVSRLGPQELYTVFFLGLCNWMMARVITRDCSKKESSSQWLSISIFSIGYLGLSLSKEINIAVMLWMLVFYYLYTWLVAGQSLKKICQGLPLVVIFFYTLFKVYAASKSSHYGVAPVTLDLVLKNSIWIFKELFQVHTSVIITSFFLILSIFLLLFMGEKIIRRHFSVEIIFLFFLLGQFVSIYLVLSTSWAPVLRYWYVLVPIFTTLLAFSVKYILEVLKGRFRFLGQGVAISLVGFILFFIGCNYYNFLMQTVIQHSLRQAEAQLISELLHLQAKNKYIHILIIKGDPEAELVYHLRDYYRRFSPRFFAKKYTVYTTPPRLPHQTYYMVTMHPQLGNLDKYMIIENEKDYWILSRAKKVAEFLQYKAEPYLSRDAGAHPLNWHYQWLIYKMKA